MKILEALFEALENCPAEDEDIGDTLNQFILDKPDWNIASGETRYALVSPKCDSVIKIPRYGYSNEDYCAAELRNYESAKQYRVERLLLPIELIYTTTSGIKIYKQVKYSFSTAEAGRKYKKYLIARNTPSDKPIVDTIRRNCHDGNRINERWMARVLQLYGKKFCRSFEQWSRANKVNDLHDYNTGWLNDKPIILDYAGYRG